MSHDGDPRTPERRPRLSLDDLVRQEQVAARLLDSPEPLDPVEALAGLDSPAARRAVTDLLFVDALLARSSAAVRRREARQVDGAIAALRREGPAAVEPSGGPAAWPAGARLLGRFAVALTLLFGVVTLFQLAGPRAEAAASLDAAIEALAKRLFRAYAVTVDHASGAPATVGRLVVCGGRRFAVDWPAAIGRFEAGSNGRQRWIVPPVGPVLVSPDAAAERGSPAGLADGPPAALEYLSLAAILGRVKDRYRVAFADGLPPRTGAETRLVATHASAPLPGEPDRIEIDLAADGSVVRRVALHFPPLAVPAGPRRIEFALQATREPEPADDPLFDHQTHHEPGRAVLTVPFLP